MGEFLVLALILLPMGAAFAVFPIGLRSREARDHFVIGITAAEFLLALLLLFALGEKATLPAVCGFGLSFSISGWRVVLVLLTTFLWLMTALPSPEYFAHIEGRNRYYLFYLLTQGALLGVFLSADLYTTFLFFEMMSFTSYVWVVQNETPAAIRAAQTYLAVAVVGAMTLLFGLFLLYDLFGTLEMARLATLAPLLAEEKKGRLLLAGGCCLFGFGAKAGMFPLHIWLPKAHPVAPAPASALLSGILTKSGIYGIAAVSCSLFWGSADWGAILLFFGAITMVWGAVLAVFSIDLKRTLACSSLSQIGFILIGLGMQGVLAEENTLAVWGTVLHVMNHSLIKLLLFVAAGIVYLGTHSLNLNEIRGFGSEKRLLKGTFFVGALSLCGVPLFSGYISKTLLHESIVEGIHLAGAAGVSTFAYRLLEGLFLFSGGLTIAYMTKIFVAVFVDKKVAGHHVPPSHYLSRGAEISLLCSAGILLLLGLTPTVTMQNIALFSQEFFGGAMPAEALHYFSPENLKGAGISLAIGVPIYLFFVRRCLMRVEKNGERVYLDRLPAWMDLEEKIYRPALGAIAFAGAFFARLAAGVGDGILGICRNVLFARAPGVIVPKGDEEFGVYGNDPERHLITETFAFDLLLVGIGLAAILGYLIWKL